MNTVKNGINLIGLLTGAFGGFLLNMSPPEDGLVFISGLTLITGVAIYLLVQAIFNLVKEKKHAKTISVIFSAIALGVFIMLSFKYDKLYDELVFEYGQEELLVGCGSETRYQTDTTQLQIASNRYMSAVEKAQKVGVKYLHKVWNQEDLVHCRTKLKTSYFVVVNLFFIVVFVLTTFNLQASHEGSPAEPLE